MGTNNLNNTIAINPKDNSVYFGVNFTVAGTTVSEGITSWKESVICDALVQEYRINGVWSSGESQLDIDEGTETILSILPNTIDFQIRLPNSEIVSGDYNLGNITPEQAGEYTFIADNGCELPFTIAVLSSDPCIDFDTLVEYKVEDGDWILGESSVILDEGKSFSLRLREQEQEYIILLPNGTSVTNELLVQSVSETQAGSYTLMNDLGCSSTFVLDVISNGTVCTNTLENENELIVFEAGRLINGLDTAFSTNTDVNFSDCAFEVGNENPLQPWSKYVIPINLERNGIRPGDELVVSVDGKSITGTARIEVVENNNPNTWEIGHTFPNQWQNHTQTIVVPENLRTLDIWLHSNYNSLQPGSAVYDNLRVTLIEGSTEEEACNNGFENESSDITFEGIDLVSGLDSAELNTEETNNSGCSLEVVNANISQPWARYTIEIAIDANNLQVGEEVFFSVDGKSEIGQARIEVVENDRPNSWKLGHNFTNEWTTYQQVLTVPENLITWNVWLFSNYNMFTGGNALYDNLIVSRVSNGELIPLKATLQVLNGGSVDLNETATLYPNPTTGPVNISFTASSNPVNAVYIYNLSNVLLETKNLAQGNLDKVDFDLSNYPSGT